MEITNLTINDYEYIPGDSLSDRQLLTESELMAEWDATHPLPNGESWGGIPVIDGDERRREAKKREIIWMTNVLRIPLVNQNRLEPHWDIAMTVAAQKAGIGYIPQHHRTEQ